MKKQGTQKKKIYKYIVYILYVAYFLSVAIIKTGLLYYIYYITNDSGVFNSQCKDF